MCALKSRGMSAVCTWGLRGIFFLTLILFVLFYHGAVCFLCESFFLSMYCTIVLFPTYTILYYFLILRNLCLTKLRAYQLVRTSDHLPSHHLDASNFKPPSTTPPNSIATIEFTSPCNQTSFFPISTIEFTSIMVTKKR